jgi:hypothetical protein
VRLGRRGRQHVHRLRLRSAQRSDPVGRDAGTHGATCSNITIAGNTVTRITGATTLGIRVDAATPAVSQIGNRVDPGATSDYVLFSTCRMANNIGKGDGFSTARPTSPTTRATARSSLRRARRRARHRGSRSRSATSSTTPRRSAVATSAGCGRGAPAGSHSARSAKARSRHLAPFSATSLARLV